MLKTKIATILTLAGLLSAVACDDAGVPSGGAPGESAGSARGAVPSVPPPAGVRDMLAEISPQSVKSAVERLVSFGTRHTLSDVDSPARGIGAARLWIKSELERYATGAGAEDGSAMKVYFDRHTQAPDGDRVDREVEIVNVVAELPGTLPEARERRYYVIGHYDSRASDPMDHLSDAPGANDDASGVAVVMELARVLSRHRFDSTLVFMATAGEEQGLYGAWFHAREAKERDLSIRAVLSNDIVGDPSAPSGARHDRHVRLFSEALPAALTPEELGKVRRLSGWSDSPSRQIARAVAEVAAWHALPVQPMLVL
ncbi:MAG: M28 family peptidase, partial [Acidobacteriota bacterium]